MLFVMLEDLTEAAPWRITIAHGTSSKFQIWKRLKIFLVTLYEMLNQNSLDDNQEKN